MSAGRLELKVGLFMFACLVLAVWLSISFSETKMGFKNTYTVKMEIDNAGTLVPKARVVMAGVQIGYVDSIELSPNGKNAVIVLHIFEENKLYKNDHFNINTVGFMGDQFVAVTANETDKRGDPLKSGSQIQGIKPFELFEAAEKFSKAAETIEGFAIEANTTMVKIGRTAEDLLLLSTVTRKEIESAEGVGAKLEQTVSKLHTFVDKTDFAKINKTIDDIQKWTGDVGGITEKLSKASGNIEIIAEEVKNTTRNISGFVSTNSLAFGAIVTNVKDTTVAVNMAVGDLQRMVANTQSDVTNTFANIKKLSGTLNDTANRLEKMMAENDPVVGEMLVNAKQVSKNLDEISEGLKKTILANQKNLDDTFKNIRDVSEDLKSAMSKIDNVLTVVDSGKGIAGGVLKNEKMGKDFIEMVAGFKDTIKQFEAVAADYRTVASNINVVATNINKHGILWWRGERKPITNRLTRGSVGKPK